MSASNIFVVGQCTRVRDSVFMQVRAESVGGVMRDLTHMSQKEFPPDGEIELRGARAMLKQDDWAIAKPVLDGPPRRQRWVSQTARKLLPIDDLSGLAGPEAARRLLVEQGLQDGFVGEKIFRIGPDEMVVVAMNRSEDGRCRASSADIGRLPVYRFDPAKIVVVPTPGGSVSMMEKNHQSPEIETTNWSSDAQYVAQIVRGALSEGSEASKATAAVAATLSAHADKLAALIVGAGELDSKIAREILRSRRIGELLASRPALIDELMAALRRAPDVSARVDQEIKRMTAEAVEAKRVEIASQLTASLEVELTKVRRERTARLEAELADLEGSSLRELQQKIDREKDSALTAIEVRKSGLEKAVTELEKTRDELCESHRLKTIEIEALTAHIAGLTSDVVGRKADIDRLLQMEQVLQDTGDRSKKTHDSSLFPLAIASPAAKPLPIAEIPDWLKASQLLTDAGRRGVARLATLILSGGVPVIDGPEADDTLDVLSAMLAGGAITTFDCDPTVISHDDLWRRPGSGALTALGAALSDVQARQTIRFCAIRRAELSPARFWIEVLRRAGKQRALPKEFLLCVTRADGEESESASDPSAFRADGWIERNAGIAALAYMGNEGLRRIVEVSELQPDATAALTVLGTNPIRLSIGDAYWLAVLVPVANEVLKGDAGAFFREVLESGSPDSKPNLKLIDNRGPSHA
jgi:hypothetical protein